MSPDVRNIFVFSDLHVGSTVGLWPENFSYDGRPYECNRFQKWLNECFQVAIKEVQETPNSVLVFNGDETQGVHDRDGQLMVNRSDVQYAATYQLLKPLTESVDRLYWIIGTEWHVGKGGEDIQFLAQMLGAEPDQLGHYARYELFMGLNDIVEPGMPVAHFGHHVGVSNIPMYEATVPLREAVVLEYELSRWLSTQKPDLRLVVRSHRHRFIHVETAPDFHVVVTPSWQLKTAFVFKKSSALMPHIGYILIQWDGHEVVVKKRVFALPDFYVRPEMPWAEADQYAIQSKESESWKSKLTRILR